MSGRKSTTNFSEAQFQKKGSNVFVYYPHFNFPGHERRSNFEFSEQYNTSSDNLKANLRTGFNQKFGPGSFVKYMRRKKPASNNNGMNVNEAPGTTGRKRKVPNKPVAAPKRKVMTANEKLERQRGGENYPAKHPAFTRGITGETNVKRTLLVNAVQNATRHWGTPAVHTGSIGSILETLAVGYAAEKSGVTTLYWEEAKYFPGSGPGTRTTFCGGSRVSQDVKTVMDALNKSKDKSVILLKAVIDTRPLYENENDPSFQPAWAKVLFNATMPGHLTQAAKSIGKTPTRLGYGDIPRIYNSLKPKPSKENPWKGYWNAEPDGVFFSIDDGQLNILVLEFKITQGKAESIPAEAWQMAKVKRMLEFFFREYDPIVKIGFCPWQYGQGNNSNNIKFRNPYELSKNGRNYKHKNAFDTLYRNAFNGNKLWKPRIVRAVDFQKRTGIDVSIAQSIVEAYERSSTNNIRSILAHIVRHSRLVGSRAANGLNQARNVRPNAPGVAAKNAAAARMAAAGSRNRLADCTGGKYGTDTPSISIRCLPVLGASEYEDIIRSVQRLGWLRGWRGALGATPEQVKAGMNSVQKIVPSTRAPQLYSSANLNTRKDILRLQAWRDRISDPSFNAGSVNNLRKEYLLALKWVEPTTESISSIISRVTQNASTLEPKNVNPLINHLKKRGAPINSFKTIFNKKALSNNRVFNALIARNARNGSQGVLGNYVRNIIERKNNVANN